MKKAAMIICAFIFAFATAGVSAELNPLFQDNAVLQCDQRLPVWGGGRDGEKITVEFAGQKVSTIATNGVWRIWLRPMKPNATPQTLTVAGDTTSVVTNVLVGEKTTMITRLPERLPAVEEVIEPEPVKARSEQWRCIG